MSLVRETIEREIRRLRQRHLHLIEQAVEAPCLWDVVDEALHWRVFLTEVLEPDLDVELLEEVIVVRGEVERRTRQAIVCVPAPFETRRARIRFENGVLEIRVECSA